MKETFGRPIIENCHCLCHHEHCNSNFVPECIHLNLNQSQIIPEPIERNISQRSFNYNYDSPLFNPKKENEIIINDINNNTYSRQSILLNEVKNEINKDNLNLSRKYDIKERAKVIKDKINTLFLLKRMNNNKIINKNNFDNNNPNNIIKKFTFCENSNFNNFNKKGKTPMFRKKIENELKWENPVLKRLLSSIPKHEKNRSGKRQADEKEKLLFTNGIFRVKSFDSKYNKKFTGYSSMVMPPNILSKLTFMSKN